MIDRLVIHQRSRVTVDFRSLKDFGSLFAGPSFAALFLMALGCQGQTDQTISASGESAPVVEIQRLGGKVEFDGKAPGRPVVKVNWQSASVTDQDLALLEGFPDLQTLE